MTQNDLPQNLLQAAPYFADPDHAQAFAVAMRWPDGVRCPFCGHDEHWYIATRRIWRCKQTECRKQFSVKKGTIFEDSPLSLDRWLVAIWLMVNAKNGISSHELGRALEITQKSAWFMEHRIRAGLTAGSLNKLSGTIEADETYIGGKVGNMHRAKSERRGIRGGHAGKAIVAGVAMRGGEIRAEAVSANTARELQAAVRRHVEPGSAVYTDELKSYKGLRGEYDHRSVSHFQQVYVDGDVLPRTSTTSGACSSGRSRAPTSTSSGGTFSGIWMSRATATASATGRMHPGSRRRRAGWTGSGLPTPSQQRASRSGVQLSVRLENIRSGVA